VIFKTSTGRAGGQEGGELWPHGLHQGYWDTGTAGTGTYGDHGADTPP
jgi:hypothetical protein